ncbi:MAG: thymidine kinase [Nevskia sp.]
MAKLYFRYAAMNAGKSTALLQVAHNYEERGQRVDLYTSVLDGRYGGGRIVSRLGVARDAATYAPDTDFEAIHAARARPACLLIDEAQFLSPAQVVQLHRLAHLQDIPVICYGLRSDFRGDGFPGSLALLTLADDLEEMKTVCRCGRKATMNLRFDAAGHRITEGAQVEIGGDDRYEAVCARRYYTGAC